MQLKKVLPLLGGCMLASTLLAQDSSATKCPPYPDGSLADPTPLFNAIDTNHDGKITREEWTKAEAPEPSWNAFQTKALVKQHGYITLFDFLTDTPPNGIDTGCKGYMTLDDFLATKKMAGPPGGGAGGPGGPGGAPGGAQGGAPGGAGGPGGPGGDAQGNSQAESEKKTPKPHAPRTALAPGTYSTDAPGKCPPYPEGGIADPTPLFEAIDKNHDGKLTYDEWQAAGAPEPSWKAFMSKPRVKKNGYITLYDFVMDTPPGGIDTNCDGYISLDEFLATKKWKMGGPPQGGASAEKEKK
jgi:hypothetical protein